MSLSTGTLADRKLSTTAPRSLEAPDGAERQGESAAANPTSSARSGLHTAAVLPLPVLSPFYKFPHISGTAHAGCFVFLDSLSHVLIVSFPWVSVTSCFLSFHVFASQARASAKKFRKVTLTVSPKGIIITDTDTTDLIENVSIYR